MSNVILECPQCKKRYTLKDESQLTHKLLCKTCHIALQVLRPPDVAPGLAPADFPAQPAAGPTPAAEFSLTDAPDDVRESFRTNKNLFARKYIILKQLGKGGMGEVLKGWDIFLRRYVAIKMILPASRDTEGADASHDNFIKRFVREAQTTAKLSHPNILQVYEVGKIKDNYYIVVEYLAGGTLDEYWKKKHETTDAVPKSAIKASAPRKSHLKMPSHSDIKEYLTLMIDVLNGMDYAHKHNIIHRDIKPENILLFYPDTKEKTVIPKVSDFGIAKDITSDRNLTVAGTVVGTPTYMSPEQATAGQIDTRSDIFSLGSVLYKLCTDKEPFSGKSLIDIIKAVSNKDPIPPGQINRAIDRDLEIIILKAMEKEPDRRYATAAELGKDIERYLKGEAIKAHPASAVYRVTKKIKSNKIAFVGIGLAVIILIVVLVGLGISRANRRGTAQEYLKKADELYQTQQWKDANDYYIKYLELIKDDRTAQKKMAECSSQLKEKEEMLRQEALKKEQEKQASEAAREKDKKISEEVQEAWMYASQVFTEFYKKNANMEKVWKCIDTAINMLTKSIESHPTPMGYFYRALLLKEKNKMKEAEQDLTEAIKIKPDFDTAYVIRGIIHFEYSTQWAFTATEQKQMETMAKEDFSKVRPDSKMPEQFEVYKIIMGALISYDNNEIQKSISILEEGHKKYGSEEFLFWLAAVNKTNPQKALEYLNNFIEIKPQFARAYNIRAMIKQYDTKDLDGAIEDYTTAIRINPNFAIPYANRGSIRQNKGDADGAIEDCDKAIQIDPAYAGAYSNRAAAKYAKGDYDGSIEDATKAIELNPNIATFYVNRATAQTAKKENYDSAINDFNKALKLDPGCADAYVSRGMALYLKGEKEAAIEDFNKALKLKPNLAEAYLNRGSVKQATGDKEGALADFNKALQLKPNLAEAYGARGYLFYTMGKYPEALADINKAIELNPRLKSMFEPIIQQIQK